MFSSLTKKRKLKALGKPLDPPANPTDVGNFGKMLESFGSSQDDEKQRLDELWNIMRGDRKCVEVINKHNLTRDDLGTIYHSLASGGFMGTPAFCALADAETLDYILRADNEPAQIERVAMFCKKYGV